MGQAQFVAESIEGEFRTVDRPTAAVRFRAGLEEAARSVIELRSGMHPLRFEPPDLFYIDVSGDVSAADIRTIFQSIAHACRDHGKLYIIANVTRMGKMSPDARKVASTKEYELSMAAMIIIGATFTQRTILGLIDKAYRALTREPNAPAMVFVASPEEADRWISRQKAQ